MRDDLAERVCASLLLRMDPLGGVGAFDEFDGKLSDPLVNANGMSFFVRFAVRASARAAASNAVWRFPRGSRLRSVSGLVEVED